MSDKKLNKDNKQVIDSLEKLKNNENEKKISGKTSEEKETQKKSSRNNFSTLLPSLSNFKSNNLQKIVQDKKKNSNDTVVRAKVNINNKFKSVFSKIMNKGNKLLENNKQIIDNNSKLFDVDKKIKATENPDIKDELNLEKERLEVEKEELKIECHHINYKYHRKQKGKYKFSKREDKKLKELEKKSDKSEKEVKEEEKLKKRKRKYEEEEKAEKYHEESRDRDAKHHDHHVSDLIDKIKDKRDKLREEIKKQTSDAVKEKLEKKLKSVNKHFHHLHRAKEKITNKINEFGSKFQSYWERIKNIFLGEDVSAFIFYCAVSVFIFTFTAFIAYSDETYINDNPKAKDYHNFLIYAGVAYFVIFIFIMIINFTADKPLLEKGASAFLLLSAYYLALFFLYLKINGDFSGEDLSSREKNSVTMATGISVAFIFTCIYYDLFSKHNRDQKLTREISNLMGIGFVLMSIGFFFIMGGMISVLAFGSKYKRDNALSFLMPLSGALFIIGIFGIVAILISIIKPLDELIGNLIEGALDSLETLAVKIVVFTSFVMTIYYTYLLYRLSDWPSYNLKLMDHKNRHKLSYVDHVIDGSFKAGAALICFFLLILGLLFGGSFDERLFSVFLVFFVTFVGSLFLWLSQQNRIGYNSSTLKDAIIGTEIVFVLLLVATVFYVLFFSNPPTDATIIALGKVLVHIFVPIFFLFVYVNLVVTFFWVGVHGHLRIQMIIALVVGLVVIIGDILALVFLEA